MRDKSLLRYLTQILLNSPSTLHQFTMENPLFAARAATVEEAVHEEVASLEPMPGEFFFILNPLI